MKIHIDMESRSACDLRKAGAVRYAMDPTTELLCLAYNTNDVYVPSWQRGQKDPEHLLDLVLSGVEVCAHNAMFELAMWIYYCVPKLGWPKLSPWQMDCTMARAQIMALPSSLDDVCKALRVPQQKSMTGHALMMRMCKPRNPRKDEDPTKLYWHEDPEDMKRLVEYCCQDVRAEMALDNALPQMTASERDIYHTDLVINLRGFRLDTALMRKAEAFRQEAQRRVDAELAGITRGKVQQATKVIAIKDWISARGIEVSSLAKGEIQDLIDAAKAKDDPLVGRVLELRRTGAKATSLAKYKAGLTCAGPDERVRGVLNYHKASTGRWAGSLYQPHNLERVDPDSEDPRIIEQMTAILTRARSPSDAVDWAELVGLDPMRALGKCTRAMICAPDGWEFIGADYSNIEGRGSAWLGGEAWKVKAFRDYDMGVGPDLYKLAYSKSFGEPVESIGKGRKRQIGKVQELALGYQGAVGAFMTMGANYGIDADGLLAAVRPVADLQLWATTEKKFERSPHYGLDLEHWTAFRYVVDSWRLGHPNIVAGWWEIQDAVIAAVDSPGEILTILNGKVRVTCTRNRAYLYIYLPSGRALAYFMPRLKATKDEHTGRDRLQVVIQGKNNKGRWGDVYLYGGLLWENVVQALCRDLLAGALMACERTGYPVVLHVHDEVVVEVPKGAGRVEEVQQLMTQVPPWARGIPVNSSAWRDERYVK